MCRNRDAKRRLLQDIAPMVYYMKSHKNMIQTEHQMVSMWKKKKLRSVI